ncbi:MAG: sodium-dependent transporter [Treponema sp.]|nr:sodium-dependent transporter [Treponema sp.]
MSDVAERQQWGSKAGFLMSAIGSAVGLGNIWRFPYVLYEQGGGAFLIPYLVAMFTAAIPLLVLEYTIGSQMRGTSALSWARIRAKYEWLGWLQAFFAGCIMVYYSAILSWAISYTRFAFTMAWGDDPNGFFFGSFLKLSDGPMQIGTVNLAVLAGLVLLWGSAFLVCSRRVRGLEKANLIMMPALFILMLIIIIRGLMLPGAAAGLNTLFTPDFHAMLNPRVWLAAYGHVFFSCSLASGVMVTYSSYLPKKSELTNSACIAGFSNSFFEILCAVGVFSILGFMAGQQGVPATEVATSGIGLAFIAFPAGFNTMGNLGVFFSITFFFALVVGGYTSLLSLMEAFIAPFTEKFKISRRKGYAILCSLGFAASILFTTNGGLYILDIADFFINNFGLVLVGLLEAFIVGWLLKTGYFRELANANSYFKFGRWWDACIRFIIPIMLSSTIMLSIRNLILNGYEGYPMIAMILYGALLIALCFVFSFVLQSKGWAIPVQTAEVQLPPGRGKGKEGK